MKIHNDSQGTIAWLEVRLGKLTGSDSQTIATNGKGLETLCYEKVAEILTGKIKESYTNPDMERGNLLENTARGMYELETSNSVTEVGFCELDDYTGCSPDGLVGEDGLIEIKCPNDGNFVKYSYLKEIDAAHMWQMQFNMFVTDRKWCDYIVYNENFAKGIITTRIMRDEKAIEKIKIGVDSGKKTITNILGKVDGKAANNDTK